MSSISKKKREEQIKSLISREYRVYQEEEKFRSLPQTLYEKSCAFAERVLHIEPDKKARAKIQETIDFAHLKVTPAGIASLTIFFALVTMLPPIILMLLGMFNMPGLPFGYSMMIIILALFFTYYLYTYPSRLRRRYESDAGGDIVTFVLYVAMYMRNVPSLEGAVRFAADNITGTLGYEIKKMLWDVEVGNYLSMQEALNDYTKKWQKNRAFVEAIGAMVSSLKQVGTRRIELLDEAVKLMLDGSREEAKHYNQALKLPVMVVHALGIILPVMGLVMFPIIAVFLHVSSLVLFIGYDMILPLVLYFVITGILESRPPTFSKIDISDNPNVPPEGKFAVGKRYVSAWPVGFLVGAPIIILGLLLYMNELNVSVQPEGILPALIVSFGIAAGFGVYYILLSRQRMAVRQSTRTIEGEFAEALFQLGGRISGGTPIELSLEQSMDRIKNLAIRELFQRALKNMKLMGFTFQQSFFDKEYGAIRYYPSKLIKSIMRTVVESTKKGVNTAAIAMMSISKYLRGLHDTQEDVREELSDTLNSLKFQSYFLSPMISGIVVTLAVIIMRILAQIGDKIKDLGNVSVPFLTSFGEAQITSFEFILIVSIYLIETSYILSLFVSAIENGEDPIGRHNITGNSLLIGFTVYTICMVLTLAIFSPLIEGILT